MARRSSDSSELVSLMFVMGRFMRDAMHKKIRDSKCDSLLGFETLRYVKDKGSPHMRDVAKNFHVAPPAATLLVDGLVKEKLLIRVLDPKDRRSIRIELTKEGRLLLEKMMAKKAAEIKRIFGTLTSGERDQLAVILRKIIKNNS